MIALHYICCFSFFLFPGTWEADTGRAADTQESQGQKGDCDAMREGGGHSRGRGTIAGEADMVGNQTNVGQAHWQIASEFYNHLKPIQ